jgi:hypothetical protein
MHLRSAFTGLTLAVVLAAGGGVEAADAATSLPGSGHAASMAATHAAFRSALRGMAAADAGRASPAMPSAPMSGTKLFVNKTSMTLQVTIFIRDGADPTKPDAGQESFTLAGGKSESISYGNSTDIYLNGLGFVASDGHQQTIESRSVLTRGSAWDNLLNTNSTITFSAPDIDSVHGSNM